MSKHSNPPAEMMLLAILYYDPTQYAVVDSYINVDDFTVIEHKMLFTIFKHVAKEQTGRINKEHVLSAVKELDINEEEFADVTDNGQYIDKIIYYSPENEDLVDWLIKVKQETYKRNVIVHMKQKIGYLDHTQDSLEDMMQSVEDDIMQIGEESNKSRNVSKQIFQDAQSVIMSLAEDPVSGINVNLPLWQDAIGKLRNKTVHFLVAFTGSGKSQFALRAAMEAAKYKPVLYCDSEMDEEIAIVRGFCIVHNIPYDYIEYGLWDKNEGILSTMGYTPQAITKIVTCARILKDRANWDRFDSVYGKNFYYLNINGL